MKIIKVRLSPEAEEVYNYLEQQATHSKIESSIFNAFHQKKELIRANPHYGDPVAKRLIPGEYVIKYGITNLFRVELPNYWRMLYSLTEGETEIEIIAFVLDVIDHDKYNKKFGYEKN